MQPVASDKIAVTRAIGKVDSRFLSGVLGKGLLVLFRIGHHEREASTSLA
jgi:hypothetical protein